jgi:hypothetical protein
VTVSSGFQTARRSARQLTTTCTAVAITSAHAAPIAPQRGTATIDNAVSTPTVIVRRTGCKLMIRAAVSA